MPLRPEQKEMHI